MRAEQVAQIVGHIVIQTLEACKLDFIADFFRSLRRGCEFLVFELKGFDRRQRLKQGTIANRRIGNCFDRIFVGQGSPGKIDAFRILSLGFGKAAFELFDAFDRAIEFRIFSGIEFRHQFFELIVTDDRLDFGQLHVRWRNRNACAFVRRPILKRLLGGGTFCADRFILRQSCAGRHADHARNKARNGSRLTGT